MDPGDGTSFDTSFGPATYGASFADVYDDWYADPSGAAAAADFLAEQARRRPEAPVLELGVGTGRVALALADRLGDRTAIHGVDASPAMLERLRMKPGASRVTVTLGDMAGDEPAGPFGLAYAAVNTFFNLDSEAAQRRCLASVAQRLVPGGVLVLEAFVPGATGSAAERARDHVSISTLTTERLVLTATREDHDAQTVTGQHVELVDGLPVRLRPWRIRWLTPAQLDDMARDAGLTLRERHGSWGRKTFSNFSTQHVSVYER